VPRFDLTVIGLAFRQQAGRQNGSGKSMSTDNGHRKHGEAARGNSAPADSAAARAARFGELPERIPPERFVAETSAASPHDPDFGRDPETDWMIRYSA
jgi:hypothetical protein